MYFRSQVKLFDVYEVQLRFCDFSIEEVSRFFFIDIHKNICSINKTNENYKTLKYLKNMLNIRNLNLIRVKVKSFLNYC